MCRKCVEKRNLRWIWDNAKKKREKEIDRSFSLAKERKLNGNFGRSLYTRVHRFLMTCFGASRERNVSARQIFTN